MNIRQQNTDLINTLSRKQKWDTISTNKVRKIVDLYPDPSSLSNKLKKLKDPQIDRYAEMISGLQQTQYIIYLKSTFLLTASVNQKIKEIL